MIFATGSIIGAMLAGWSSSNKFSMLGASRAGSQMISYEAVIGLSLVGAVMAFGTASMKGIHGLRSRSPGMVS